jgi:hypothetical protein
MRKSNPIHAAACGTIIGFVIFAAMVARSGTWWPSPGMSALGLKILLFTAATCAAAALMRNWMLSRAAD